MSIVSNRLKEIDATTSTRFLLPMLFAKDRDASFFITRNFKNCYIGDANRPDLGQKILLLYNYQMTADFVKFEHKLELMSAFADDYDYSDDREVMYVFEIPDNFKADYKLFLEGRYSEFSEEYKLTILEFWNIKGKDNLYYSVLYATDVDEQGNVFYDVEGSKEYWPKPVLTREIYMSPN